METDLFGEVPEPHVYPKCGPQGGKHYIKQAGYVAQPGTGPTGETCGTCEHMAGRGGRYRKCQLNRARWTHGPKTDVLARSPACSKWEQLSASGNG